MFSSALKSFNSNIASNYTISPSPSSASGAWKIFDGKKKTGGKAVSIFVFEKKVLENQNGLNRGSGGSSLRRLHDEVVARIKKEASMLARLRHPSVLELAEPLEDTRSGGFMFATEPTIAPLSVLLREQDDNASRGNMARRSSRSIREETGGQRDFQIDQLEVQKGMLQITQGLVFLHESAGLVHGNLTPEAIFVNAKSDWKIAGFGFAGPAEDATGQSNIPPISLSNALYHEPRLPQSLQLDLNYTSPDFAIDSTVSNSADMFSLGLILVALYNEPHDSPIDCQANLSRYKSIFRSSSTTPTPSNNFLSKKPLPNDLKSSVLPQLLARRPAQRLTARDFEQSVFFENILVSSIRFLDALPAKTPNEKSQFLKGLPKILDQFPKPMLEKKVLPSLMEETKDKNLLSLTMQNVVQIVQLLPFPEQAMTTVVLPRLKEIFAASPLKVGVSERDSARDAGLSIILDNVALLGSKCNGRDFREYLLPIILFGMESSTPALVDRSLGTISTVLSVLDYTSIKNELFPVVASVFSKTSSLGIKVRGLEAFVILCGGSNERDTPIEDDFNGMIVNQAKTKATKSSALDKYTVQEKIVPMLKAIKTKEPAVMMAALAVFRQVGQIVDTDFIATDVLPALWAFSLGHLLNLQQFAAFMDLIKIQSARVENEQIKKLREVASNETAQGSRPKDLMAGKGHFHNEFAADESNELDFAQLVLGKKNGPAIVKNDDMLGDFSGLQSPASRPPGSSIRSPASFTMPNAQQDTNSSQNPSTKFNSSRSGSDLSGLSSSITSITPSNAQLGSMQAAQPPSSSTLSAFAPMQPYKPDPWPAMTPGTSSGHSFGQFSQHGQAHPTPQQQMTRSTNQSYTAAPSFYSSTSAASSNAQAFSPFSNFSIAPPPISNPNNMMPTNSSSQNSSGQKPRATSNPSAQKKSGLDAYQSLL